MEQEAGALMSAMLDGGFEDLELGALALLERKPPTVSELFGLWERARAALQPVASTRRARAPGRFWKLPGPAPPAAPASPRRVDAAASAIAGWSRAVLSGEFPMPLPIVNQVASCVYGAGYADDINQAKAIVALETASLAA